MARRRSRVRRARRTYARDAKGRFASTGTAAKRTKRRRVGAAAVVAVGALAATQASPASRTRTAHRRNQLVAAHIARAHADHARQVSRRNKAFPTEALTPKPFDLASARAEGVGLTKGYRKQVKSARRAAAGKSRR